ncbi:MAG: hypothetical protein P8Y14_16630 [Anaerolineales bacterium]|jgi:hypothetical protein
MEQENQTGKPDHEPEPASRLRARYLTSAVIVWVAIIFASGVILAGSDQLGIMLAILGGGAAWFVVIVPAAIFRGR